MEEQNCTAALNDGDTPPNVLFTPPCGCPNCAPDKTYDHEADDGWLRISGTRQRFHVEVVQLGAVGKAVLG